MPSISVNITDRSSAVNTGNAYRRSTIQQFLEGNKSAPMSAEMRVDKVPTAVTVAVMAIPAVYRIDRIPGVAGNMSEICVDTADAAANG